jgi:hypothetical protein
MMAALIAGQRDPHTLAGLARATLSPSNPELDGSASGLAKRTESNPDTAPQADSTL